jgi:hypothetical protein
MNRQARKDLNYIKRILERYGGSKFDKIVKISNLIAAFLMVILLGLTGMIYKQTYVLQKAVLDNQNFFSEIETRPYLTIGIKEAYVVIGKENNAYYVTHILENRGRVPAKNIRFDAITLPGINFEAERNFDLMPGQQLELTMNGITKSKFEKGSLIFSIDYQGMKKDKRKYKTLIAGNLTKDNNNKLIFDPVALKIDEQAFVYREAFRMLNKGKETGPVEWPKLREGKFN